MNIIRDNEELAYRILAGDNLVNLEIATSISNNQINKSNVYIGLCHQGGITPEIKTLSNWMNTIIEEVNNMIRKKIQQDIKQNKSLRGEMEIPQYFHFNSFSLTETLKTGTITYYIQDDEIRHAEPIKISDKLYNILDSLTLFIPSNSNDSNTVDYSIIISNCPYATNHTHILLTVHPATAQYEIVNKINIINKTSKTKKQNQCYENTDIVVIPASEHRSLIDQSEIAMTNNYQFTSLDGKRFNQDRIKDYIKIYKLETQNKQQDEKIFFGQSWYIFKNIQWLHCDFESKHGYLGTKRKDYLFDTATGYQVIPDWSLTCKLGDPDKKSRRRFFLLHEQSINDQNRHKHQQSCCEQAVDDLWVYYESPSSSSSKTMTIYGYDEKTMKTYNNLDDALNDLETKINHPCHKSGMRIKGLYLLSKQQTVDDKRETLEKHNIKISE